jgi:UDP-glucose 4-epimerase
VASPLSSSCVLVTGAAGFLGSALCTRLQRSGRFIVALDNFWYRSSARLLQGSGARQARVSLDVRDPALTSLLIRFRPAIIFHLAGRADTELSIADPQSDFCANLEATVNLLDSLRRASFAGVVVFASSAAVYGEPRDTPITEDSSVFPISPYGVSKAACEAYARVQAQLFGFRVISARLFSLYGPGQRKQVVFDTIEKAFSNSDHVELLGDGAEKRDFLYISDAVTALIHLGERDAVLPRVVNVCSGTSVTVRELAGQILSIVRGGQGTLRFTGRRRPGDPISWVCVPTVLEASGFRARTKLEVGLARTIAWFRAERDSESKAIELL